MNFSTTATKLLAIVAAGLLAACGETTTTQTAPPSVDAAATSVQNPLSESGNRKLLQAMDICIDNYPNMLATRTALRTSKFSSEGQFGNDEYFSAFNRDIIVVASTGTSTPSCAFGRNKVRDDEAVLLAGGLIAAKFGDTPLIGDFSNNPRVLAGWRIKTESGDDFTLIVTNQVNIAGLFRGSLFILREFEES